jgi:hypothetical protein
LSGQAGGEDFHAVITLAMPGRGRGSICFGKKTKHSL